MDAVLQDVQAQLAEIRQLLQAPKNYLSVEQAAEYLSLSPAQLNKWRGESRGPAYVLLGRRVAHSRDALDAFCAANTVQTRFGHV